MGVLILLALATLAVHFFRKALGESPEQAARRVVRDAERLAGYRRPGVRWVRPALATVLGWASMTAVLMPVDPTLAVWIGGAMIFVGTGAVIRAMPHPGRVHPDDLDRELLELLEGAG